LGERKYRMLDREYQLTETGSPSEELLQMAVEIFEQYNLDSGVQK
jgi:hypothetical protein